MNLTQSRPYGYGVTGARLLSATAGPVVAKAAGAPGKEKGVKGFERDLAKLLKEVPAHASQTEECSFELPPTTASYEY